MICFVIKEIQYKTHTYIFSSRQTMSIISACPMIKMMGEVIGGAEQSLKARYITLCGSIYMAPWIIVLNTFTMVRYFFVTYSLLHRVNQRQQHVNMMIAAHCYNETMAASFEWGGVENSRIKFTIKLFAITIYSLKLFSIPNNIFQLLSQSRKLC